MSRPIDSYYAIARAAADPARVRAAGRPGGDGHFAYYRLHGAPRMYYSAYDCAFVAELAAQIRGAAAKEVWCIFDNTASGAATANALAMQTQVTTLLGKRAHDAGDLGQQLVGKKSEWANSPGEPIACCRVQVHAPARGFE